MIADNACSPLSSVTCTGKIGATYAERFAQRVHDLVIVAREVARMNVLATQLRANFGVAIDILKADLTRSEDIATLEARLRDDDRIGILINNAGASRSNSLAKLSSQSSTGP